MKRTLASILASAMMLFALAGCAGGNAPADDTNRNDTAEESSQATEPITISVGVPTAPPALPVLHMMEEQLLGENVTIDLNVWNAPEELLAMVQGGEHDLYAFPLTVISTLYNKGLDVRLMNVNTWGVTYFMTTDPNFTTWSDLEGKTVYIPLQSSPPDALTQYFMSEAGLTVGENVQVVYASTAEVAALLASGEAEYATLIEPQVTSAMAQNENVRRALSFETEWQRSTGTDTMIPNAGFGTTQTFLDENPELAAKLIKYITSAACMDDFHNEIYGMPSLTTDATYTEPEVQDPVVEEPSYTEPEVPVAEPTPEPVQEASPYDYVGYDLGTFCSVFGYPGDSDYGPSCMGDGEDGILYYDGFTVYTFRSSDGSETVTSVA